MGKGGDEGVVGCRECGVNGKRHKIFARVIPQFALECAPQLLHRIIIKIMHQADDAVLHPIPFLHSTAQRSAVQRAQRAAPRTTQHRTHLHSTAQHSAAHSSWSPDCGARLDCAVRREYNGAFSDASRLFLLICPCPDVHFISDAASDAGRKQ